MIEDFIERLIGFYDNQEQAFYDPSRWAHIGVKFELDGELIRSKSWLLVDGEDNPYRQSYHRVYPEGEQVRMENYNQKTDERASDLLFVRDGDYWIADEARCEIPRKNIYVSTYVKFNGKEYYSRDAGYDLETGEYLWGKRDTDGEFIFKRRC
jgi:hypothetical protein